MKAQTVKLVMYVLNDLRKIAKIIHKLDENACNYGLSKSQQTRLENLLKKADTIAKRLGLRAYHQGDPRGCSLYLVEKLKGADTDYNYGVAIV